MGIICSLLERRGGGERQNKTYFFFPFCFLNKTNICQPNTNWQHSFLKENKARPSWALTRLLYLCLTCGAHVLLSFPWSEQPCTVSSLVPLAHLKSTSMLFLCSRSASPCALVARSWSKPPGAARAPGLAPAPASDNTHAHPSPKTCEGRLEINTQPSRNASQGNLTGSIELSQINHSLLWLA